MQFVYRIIMYIILSDAMLIFVAHMRWIFQTPKSTSHQQSVDASGLNQRASGDCKAASTPPKQPATKEIKHETTSGDCELEVRTKRSQRGEMYTLLTHVVYHPVIHSGLFQHQSF